MIVCDSKTTDGRRVYAIGDIHGCLNEFKSLLNLIEQDLNTHPVPEYKIVTLGDYVDRGPDSRGVLDHLILLQKTLPLICLRGNHDQRMLEFMDIPDEVGASFLTYGGRELLQSYGVEVTSAKSLKMMSQQLKAQVSSSHIKFLDSLELTHQEGDYFFVHAGVKPGIALDKQTPDDLLWIREEFLTHQSPFEKVIVHGHTPRDEVDIQPNRINLDTYCFDTGVLSCAVLEGNVVRLIQTDPVNR